MFNILSKFEPPTILKMTDQIDTVTRYKIFIPRREFIFRTCEDGAAWQLILRKNKFQLRFPFWA